ncbi:MAG: DUF2071 domain-containing protein [Planctomycetaceae bacterium]|nr:DUF2071 domain-containing protein [Planctomycetaceae bacterium]
MRLPVITGTIDRRILVNYRVDPAAIEPLLPPPFRPKIVHGYALAGICLIRLRGVRPRWLPPLVGQSSENAAHRIAAVWDTPAGVREGVYVRRRDTNSRLNVMAGGRVFPGIHHHASFRVRETSRHFEVAMRSDDSDTSVSVIADLADGWPSSSIFCSLDEASAFYAAGSLGYSATSDPGRFQGLELACRDWHVELLAVRHVASSLFDDSTLFPPGSVEFDSALLMRGIEHEWHGREDLCCGLWNATEGVPYSAAPSDSCATSGSVSPITAA